MLFTSFLALGGAGVEKAPIEFKSVVLGSLLMKIKGFDLFADCNADALDNDTGSWALVKASEYSDG